MKKQKSQFSFGTYFFSLSNASQDIPSYKRQYSSRSKLLLNKIYGQKSRKIIYNKIAKSNYKKCKVIVNVNIILCTYNDIKIKKVQ